MKKTSIIILFIIFCLNISAADNTEEKVKSPVVQDKLFSGFYLKGGLMTSPKADGFGEKWLASIGFDSAIGKYVTWGLEFQPYYRNYSDSGTVDVSINNISVNIFLNIKAGINLGKLIRSLKFATLYAGLGAGTNLTYSMVEVDGVSGNQFDPFFAWHYAIGTEISLGKVNLILEYQGNRISATDVDPSTQSYGYWLFGIRF